MSEETIEIWDDLHLSESLLRGIYACGYEKPSPIQSKAIKPILDNKDVIAQAQSGTGKTATFCIGALSKIDISKNTSQVLIMSPVRELSNQIYEVILNLSSMMKDVRIANFVGGNRVEEDIYKLKNHTPHIIVGTPGRINDLIKRDYLKIKNIQLIILDEADEMLSDKFKDQIHDILNLCNQEIQLALFSATLPNVIKELMNTFMRDPVSIIMKKEMLTLEGISQYYVALENDHHKILTIKDLFSKLSFSQTIIYCNSVSRVIYLYENLQNEQYPVSYIHSQMDSRERNKTFEEFKSGKTRILISSNITSRGIDIQQVSSVINYDVPRCVHNYLHRIGRSGRWGRKGIAINLITPRDVENMKHIESFYLCQINELPSTLPPNSF
jgi:translation initiation factor 4A